MKFVMNYTSAFQISTNENNYLRQLVTQKYWNL